MPAKSTEETLPERWQAAYERDRLSPSDYADPAPERRAARMLAAFILTGLCFLALPGTLLGVWNLLSIAGHHASGTASIAWIQAHGQAQLFGWVGTFILGISLYALPKFRGRPLRRFRTAWAVWGLWTTGVTWRWWAGVSAQAWRAALVVSGALELVALALVLRVVAFKGGKQVGAPLVGAEDRASKRSTHAGGYPQRVPLRPSDLGSWLGICGFASLTVALAINLGISIYVVATAPWPVYPATSDRIFLLIALWGFAVPMAWGYSTRFVTVFLGLEAPVHRAAGVLCAGISAMVMCALARQFLLADLLALASTAVAIWALRIFRPAPRPAKLRGAYRGYPAFVRLAYVWLVVGALLGLAADLRLTQTGLGGASRHAVTVGFLATLIFAIGPRILPSFLNGRELYSSAFMAASLWILNLGCALRVSSEAIAYSRGGAAWTILPSSALLEMTAVVIFVVNLGITIKHPIPVWLDPDEIDAALPLYWYVTCFPKTRPLLIQTGLKTLAQVQDPPRSLSLAEAADADGAEVEPMLARLRTFFSQLQPKRPGRGQS
jgi:uncharacterized protein involved in response to NO